MELPKTASGRGRPTRLRAAALASSVGTSTISLVIMPSLTLTSAARMRSAGIPKSRKPSATTQRLVELTAQISVPASRIRAISASISSKMFWRTNLSTYLAAAARNSASRRPAYICTISPHIAASLTLPAR